MRESEASIRGRVMRDLIAHVTNDHLIGKKIKNGELRKKIGDSEPPWKCPDCFSLDVIEMDNFSMEYLQAKRKSEYGKSNLTASRRRICRSDAECIPYVCRTLL